MSKITIPNPEIGKTYTLHSGVKMTVLAYIPAKDKKDSDFKDSDFYEVLADNKKIRAQADLLKRFRLKE